MTTPTRPTRWTVRTPLRLAFVAVLAAFAAGTPAAAQQPAPATRAEKLDEAAARGAFEAASRPRPLDLSVVWVVRLEIAGKPVEVTSLQPVFLPEDAAARGVGTALAFNEARDRLVLVTRLPGAGGERAELPTAALSPAAAPFDFTVLDEKGAARRGAVRVLSAVRRP